MEKSNDEYELQNTQKKQNKGSGMFHILPVRLKNDMSFNDNVDSYFETRIEENNMSDNCIQCKYKTFFRGRGLYGNKYKTSDGVNMAYYELVRNDMSNTNQYVVNTVNDINEYYLWKYDESIQDDESLLKDMDEFISKLSVLN